MKTAADSRFVLIRSIESHVAARENIYPNETRANEWRHPSSWDFVVRKIRSEKVVLSRERSITSTRTHKATSAHCFRSPIWSDSSSVLCQIRRSFLESASFVLVHPPNNLSLFARSCFIRQRPQNRSATDQMNVKKCVRGEKTRRGAVRRLCPPLIAPLSSQFFSVFSL